MKSTRNSIILFTIFLAVLVGFEPFLCLKLCKAESDPTAKSQQEYNNLLQRLETFSSNHLPFEFKIDAIEHLRMWYPKHKNLYLKNYYELSKEDVNFAPVAALTKTIDRIFGNYENKATKHQDELESIREGDPIGFILFVTNKLENDSSVKLGVSIAQFYITMLNRLLLFHCRSNFSLIYDPTWKPNGHYGITEIPLEEITTEGEALCGTTIDYFLEIAMEEFPHLKMYRRHRNSSDYEHYQLHESADIDDVQILFGGSSDPSVMGHWFCIRYEATSRKVLVYDATMKDILEPIHRKIIHRLYPYRSGIAFRKPKTIQTDETSCGLYSIIYATTIILGEEPAKYDLKLNYVLGDESLYMRLHILKMFAHRKLALFNGR